MVRALKLEITYFFRTNWIRKIVHYVRSKGCGRLEGYHTKGKRVCGVFTCLTCSQIFSFIENDERDIEYAIKSAFLEIYKEKIYDLLSPNPKETSLKVRESPSKGVWVDGLHEEVRTIERFCSHPP